jgi:hypothetical protein
MKTTMLCGLAAVAFALVMVLPAVSMAGEGEWRSYEYEFQEMGPTTSSPHGAEEMSPAVPGKDMSPEEMTPSASEPQKEPEEMAPAGSASRHEEYVYPKNAPYREPPVESQPY